MGNKSGTNDGNGKTREGSMKLGEEPRGRGRREEGQGVWRGGGGVAPSKWALKWQLVWPHVQKNSLQATKAPQKSSKQASALPPCRNRTTHQRTSHTYDQVKEGLGVGREGGGAGRGATMAGWRLVWPRPKTGACQKSPPPLPPPYHPLPSPPRPSSTCNSQQSTNLNPAA